MWDHSFWLMAGWQLHALFATALFLGIVLFVIWAARLKSKVLIKWVTWLLVVGILGTLLTCGFGWKGMRGMMGSWNGGWQTGMMEEIE